MMVRRLLRAAAGSATVLAFGLLTACSATTHSTPSAADGTTAPTAGASPAGSMKTLPPSRLCTTALTTGAAQQLIADPRLQTRLSPNKGDAPDGCSYAAADGQSTLALTPASRAYKAELSAAHALSADPASAGMRDVRVDPVSDLGRQAFRETSYQIQARQHITFVVWNSGTRTWVLTFATTADTSATPATVSDDKVVQVARSITAKLPAGQ
ncbi:hypothetical protein [Streptomyces fulvoviolaceus]|uniref:hypothetical protein n=1 Tax=Streptomyces fulvoviolaceus TaxID=285535 RepID=UPI0004CA5CBF|nr:hypothetical protein [Streptomyces fulvoviolaceus]